MSQAAARAKRRARARAIADRDAAVREIWASIPGNTGCKGLCSPACTWIKMSDAERDLICRTHGIKLIDMEVRYVAPATVRCKAFDFASNRCTVYEERPLVCRGYGATEAMPCPHGCEPPGGRASAADFAVAMVRLMHLDGEATEWDPETVREAMTDPHLADLFGRCRSCQPEDLAAFGDALDAWHTAHRAGTP